MANGEENELVGPVELGVDPKSGKKATLRKGPYGHYVQLDEEGDEKPKRVSLPRGVTIDRYDTMRRLQQATRLPPSPVLPSVEGPVLPAIEP